jgi:hypothetical protein
MRTVRWLLVVPFGVGGAFLGFLVAVHLYELAAKLCPAEYLLSGICTAPWYPALEQFIMSVGASLGAISAVALPAVAAPAKKFLVAATAFLLGSVYSILLVTEVGGYILVPAFVAIASGVVATLVTRYRDQQLQAPKQ